MSNLNEQLTISEIRKNLAQEHNWEQQEKHYKEQQKHWKWVLILGGLAVLAQALKPLWS